MGMAGPARRRGGAQGVIRAVKIPSVRRRAPCGRVTRTVRPPSVQRAMDLSSSATSCAESQRSSGRLARQRRINRSSAGPTSGRSEARGGGSRSHDVGRLQVAVDHPVAVGGSERVGDLGGDHDGLRQRHRTAGQPVRQGPPFQVLHHEEHTFLVLSDIVQGADVRVVQGGDRLGFLLEPARRPGSALSWEESTLRATSRSSLVSRARKTSPMPPAPTADTISYGPRRVPAARLIRTPGRCERESATRGHSTPPRLQITPGPHPIGPGPVGPPSRQPGEQSGYRAEQPATSLATILPASRAASVSKRPPPNPS